MKVFIAISSAETQHVASLKSCYTILREQDDELLDEWKTRGDVARDRFVDYFLSEKKYTDEDGILLLDADQMHPVNLLEKLRAHDLDMVCAHCYRRNTNPIQSLCYEIGNDTFPYLPYLPGKIPREGMHEIAVTGFGCVLIKKKVLKAVQATLPKGACPIAIGPMPEIVPDNGNWGPDFRFFIKARKLGYKLWLDASVESLHATNVWLGHKSADGLIDYSEWADAAQEILRIRLELRGVELEAFKQRLRILEVRRQGFIEKADKIRQRKEAGEEVDIAEEYTTSISIYEMDGRIKEMNAWVDWAEKYPTIDRPDKLPTTKNMEKNTILPDLIPDREDAKKEREAEYMRRSQELIDMLPDAQDGKG